MMWVILALVIGASCNIWDNVFSQINSPSILAMDKCFQAKYLDQQQQLSTHLDFNGDLQLLTIHIKQLQYPILTLQVHLPTQIISVQPKLALQPSKCERYKVVNSKNINQPTNIHVNQQAILLLFYYRGKAQTGQLIQQMRLDLLNLQFLSSISGILRPVLLIDQTNGHIKHIYQDIDQSNEIQFTSTSAVKSTIPCSQRINEVTPQQLKDKVKWMVDYGEDIHAFQDIKKKIQF